jgi:ribosomal 50S subunit-associated protein YjgA (DUF615 family)
MAMFPSQTIARLMQQATFGASRQSLDQFFSKHNKHNAGLNRTSKSRDLIAEDRIQGMVAEWVKEQLALPYTSLRK